MRIHHSACTCPGEDHPGPSNLKGRGAPEIDILEVEHNKTGGPGQVVSQSAQFAPFSHDYFYANDTQDEWWVYDSSVTRPNSYKWVSPFVIVCMADWLISAICVFQRIVTVSAIIVHSEN